MYMYNINGSDVQRKNVVNNVDMSSYNYKKFYKSIKVPGTFR